MVLFGAGLVLDGCANAPLALAAVLLGSLVPDLDSHQNVISAATYNQSRWVARRFGHRTVLHTPLIWFPLLILGYFTGGVLLWFAVGGMSHVALDMLTPDGGQLWPCKSRAVWNKYMMIRNETYVFPLMIALVCVEVVACTM